SRSSNCCGRSEIGSVTRTGVLPNDAPLAPNTSALGGELSMTITAMPDFAADPVLGGGVVAEPVFGGGVVAEPVFGGAAEPVFGGAAEPAFMGAAEPTFGGEAEPAEPAFGVAEPTFVVTAEPGA